MIKKLLIFVALLTTQCLQQQGESPPLGNLCTPGKCLMCVKPRDSSTAFCGICWKSAVTGQPGQTSCQGTQSIIPLCEVEMLVGPRPSCFRCKSGYWPIQTNQQGDVECQSNIVCTQGAWDSTENAFSCRQCPNGMKLADSKGLGGCVDGGQNLEGCVIVKPQPNNGATCDFCRSGYRLKDGACEKLPDGQEQFCGDWDLDPARDCERCNWDEGYFSEGVNESGGQICLKEGTSSGGNGGQGPPDGGDGGNEGGRGKKKSWGSILGVRCMSLILGLVCGSLFF